MAQKPEPKEDLRIQRTRKLLQEALFDLTIEKGFAAITVRDIAARARVNRSTFYRHYLDKYDLLDQYMNELHALVAEAASSGGRAGRAVPEKVPAGLLFLIEHVQEYAAFYRVMLGQKGDPSFIQRFRQMSENRYRYLFSQYGGAPDPKAPPLDLKLGYISSAAVGAMQWWLENDQPCPPDQFAIWLGQLSMTSAGLPLPELSPA